LSRFQDNALPLLIAVPFVTGFLAMHPASNPFSYEAVLLVHVMSANLIFVLIPITKLSHVALMPSVQFVSEIGWKWPADSGSRVAVALRKEEEPV
jgi:CBS-domain-containing membrane protein